MTGDPQSARLPAQDEQTEPGAVVFAYAVGGLLALGLGLALLAIPIQVSDSFGNMLKLSVPWRDMVVGEFNQRAYLRPFLWLLLKAVYDISDGAYYAWFRGTHVAQVVALVALYIHLVRPRRWRDAAVVPLGLAALVGHHTFAGTVNEAFPVNTFMTVLVCCLAAAAISLGRFRPVNDALAVLLLVFAALSVESGLLVAVIFVAGAVVGATGVSRRGLVALGVTLVGYFLLRFVTLDIGSPALTERASGYGFSVLEPAELVSRFGAAPWSFYAYNVVTSAMSVLFGEPRAGVFRLTHGFSLGAPYPALMVTTVACTLGTVLIAAHAWRRRTAWLRREFTRDDRLLLLFPAVLAANAVISYPYTKSVIMSPAGACFALALCVAARSALQAWRPATLMRSVGFLAACLVLSVTWSVRVVGIHVDLWVAARDVRNEWVYVDGWIASQGIDVSAPGARELLESLRTDALRVRPPASERAWMVRSLFY